jgi:hypothetical protein
MPRRTRSRGDAYYIIMRRYFADNDTNFEACVSFPKISRDNLTPDAEKNLFFRPPLGDGLDRDPHRYVEPAIRQYKGKRVYLLKHSENKDPLDYADDKTKHEAYAKLSETLGEENLEDFFLDQYPGTERDIKTSLAECLALYRVDELIGKPSFVYRKAGEASFRELVFGEQELDGLFKAAFEMSEQDRLQEILDSRAERITQEARKIKRQEEKIYRAVGDGYMQSLMRDSGLEVPPELEGKTFEPSPQDEIVSKLSEMETSPELSLNSEYCRALAVDMRRRGVVVSDEQIGDMQEFMRKEMDAVGLTPRKMLGAIKDALKAKTREEKPDHNTRLKAATLGFTVGGYIGVPKEQGSTTVNINNNNIPIVTVVGKTPQEIAQAALRNHRAVTTGTPLEQIPEVTIEEMRNSAEATGFAPTGFVTGESGTSRFTDPEVDKKYKEALKYDSDVIDAEILQEYPVQAPALNDVDKIVEQSIVNQFTKKTDGRVIEVQPKEVIVNRKASSMGSLTNSDEA